VIISWLKKHKKYVVTASLSLAGLILLYVLFNWVMGAALHSRKEVMVPDLRGKSLDEAMSIVAPLNVGLKKEGEEFDRSVPAGTILRQNPLPGMTVREGKIVRITLSQGGEVVFVPDVTGQPVRTAEISIRSMGFALGEESARFSVVMERGRVVAQDPAPGSFAEKDSIVNLVISAGPPAEGVLLMPRLVGKNIDEARSWAQVSYVALEVIEENNGGVDSGSILRQDPAPDTDITEQKKAVIYVAGTHENNLPAGAGKMFYYEVPQGDANRQIRLTLIDETGEHEIFKGERTPGSKLEIPINPSGNARVRVFINNILVEQREVK